MANAYDYSRLLGKIREKGFTQSDIANAIHISAQTLTDKLHNRVDFKQSEIIGILDILGESLSKIDYYFFAH